jgi:hypothetical protein
MTKILVSAKYPGFASQRIISSWGEIDIPSTSDNPDGENLEADRRFLPPFMSICIAPGSGAFIQH